MPIPALSGLRIAEVTTLPAASANAGVLLRQGGKLWYSDGTAWRDATPALLVAVQCLGKPANDERIAVLAVTEAFTLPAGLTNARGVAEVAATGSSVFSLRKNGTQFGTATFAASGTTATFAAASATSFAAGDRLSIIAPATADATLADIAMTLVSE